MIQTVVLTVDYSTRASYYLDWSDAFQQSPHFAVTMFNLFRRVERSTARRAIETAELVVALHSCSADTLEYIAPVAGALKARRGQFLMFVGNEYNLPWSRIADKRQFVAQVGADFVATQLLLEAGEWLYQGTGAKVLALPHALNEAAFRREKDDRARRFDIGGRSARYPVFLGDDERNRVFETFRRLGPEAGLTADIDSASGSRLSRPDWAAFLNDCRGTIGTEAGSWYLDRDDSLVLEIRDFLHSRAGYTLHADGLAHSLSRRLPYSIKEGLRGLLKRLPLQHEAMEPEDGSRDDIWERFFVGRPRAPVYAKCISSRHFDAAGTGTCQLLVRGRYNDILVADEHYFALEPDLRNCRDVIARFRDPAERKRVADSAYAHIRSAHTYKDRLSLLHDAVCETAAAVP